MLTYLGDLGGLMDIIILIGVSLSSPFVARLFHAALVKKTYRIQHFLRDMTPYYESRKTNGKLTTESESLDSDAEAGNDDPPFDEALKDLRATNSGTMLGEDL